VIGYWVAHAAHAGRQYGVRRGVNCLMAAVLVDVLGSEGEAHWTRMIGQCCQTCGGLGTAGLAGYFCCGDDCRGPTSAGMTCRPAGTARKSSLTQRPPAIGYRQYLTRLDSSRLEAFRPAQGPCVTWRSASESQLHYAAAALLPGRFWTLRPVLRHKRPILLYYAGPLYRDSAGRFPIRLISALHCAMCRQALCLEKRCLVPRECGGRDKTL